VAILLTVRGRKSGVPRSTPAAMVNVGAQRWIMGTFGMVAWVQNLHAALEAIITIKGRAERVLR
jgi:deazaflavin-dependent oxidoreductase (nitroreductase family)